MEYEVGETVKIFGKTYKVLEGDCKDCAFCNGKFCELKDAESCNSNFRKDKKDVIYIEVLK